jgi:undecaprenyl-phosphate 4-deoxy-4-formamido-L-arabinose transferase
MSDGVPLLSVVIPVFNEEEGLGQLFARLYPALDALGRAYEIVFVDDGSADRSVAILRAQFQQRPDVTRVVVLQTNFGQHAAILAGFERSRGRFVVTLDADLQNPPEEIGKLLTELEKGHDYVGTWRANRQDVGWRKFASRAINALRERTTPIKMADHGCMLRGYGRPVIDAIVSSPEVVTYIPALAALYAGNPTEIEVRHEERAAGTSKYSVYKLARLNFDLMTGFSTVPLQIFSAVGLAVSALSGLLFLYLVVRRLMLGPEVDGVFTLFALTFFFLGVALVGIGLLGEYVGRIYVQVRGRPRFLVAAVLEAGRGPAANDAATARAGATGGWGPRP